MLSNPLSRINASQKLWTGHPVAKKSDKPRHITDMLNGGSS